MTETSARRELLAGTFRAIGADYDRYRPGYPERAAEIIVPEPVPTALELGLEWVQDARH